MRLLYYQQLHIQKMVFMNTILVIKVKILENNYLLFGQASQMGARVLETLGYKTITDIDLDKNPNILKEFDTVILLHNEYVTNQCLMQ